MTETQKQQPAAAQPSEPKKSNGIPSGRIPACDLDAEAAVLSACLLRPDDVIDDIRAILPVDAFYSDANRRIFEATLWCSDNSVPVDLVAVAQRLRDQGRLAQVGGTPYLGQIADATPAVLNAASHAAIVRNLWRVRMAGYTALKYSAEAYQSLGGAEEIQAWLERAEGEFADIAHLRETSFLRPLSDVLKEVYSNVSNAYHQKQRLQGTPTGFTKVDEMLAGFRDGDLIVVAGRPGMGKSAYALCCALNAADAGFGVAFFSLEMPAVQLGLRILSTEARIDLSLLRKGRFDASVFSKIATEIQRLSQYPIWVDDTPGITVFEIRARIRRLQKEIAQGKHQEKVTQGRLGLAVTDYLQLQKPVIAGRSREEEVSNTSKASKEMAKQLAIPYMLLSQLNRNPEKRTDKRPELADLRESGSIEQDADVVKLLYRPAYYDRKQDPALKGWAELWIEKQRNGPTGMVKLAFQAEYARFDNFDENEWSNYDPRDDAATYTPPIDEDADG